MPPRFLSENREAKEKSTHTWARWPPESLEKSRNRHRKKLSKRKGEGGKKEEKKRKTKGALLRNFSESKEKERRKRKKNKMGPACLFSMSGKNKDAAFPGDNGAAQGI
jgi:hypothetical protein